MILAAAIAGEGFALGRGPAVAEHLARGRLVRPFAGVWRAEWSYWMVAPAPALRRPAVMAVVDWLAAQCADDEA